MDFNELARCASEPIPDTEPHVARPLQSGADPDARKLRANRAKLAYASMEEDCQTTRSKRDRLSTDRLLALLIEHHDYSVFVPVKAPTSERIKAKIVKPQPPNERAVSKVVYHISEMEGTQIPARPRVARIQDAVCFHFGITKQELLSNRRTKNVTRPRQIGYWLAKQLTLRSLPEIGWDFGKRDHTTILYGVRKIDELLKTDRELERDIAIIKARI